MARAAGVADFFLERCRSFYPGVMDVIDRMVPTYPQHAGRRAEEMAELAEAIAALGLRADMVAATAAVTRAIADAGLERQQTVPWTTDSVLEALHNSGALRATTVRERPQHAP